MEVRMLYPLLLLTTTHIIPTSTVVDCRTACGRCDERNDPAELLEVYCSMCEECMERREEWLRNDGDSRRGRSERYDEDSRRTRNNVGFDTRNRKYYPYMAENCMPPVDQCPQPLSYYSTQGSVEIEESEIPTTASTSTTTTTTAATTTIATQRPSVPHNNINNNCCCPSIPCIPLLPMCPGICPQQMLQTKLSTSRGKKLTAFKPSGESLYFYLGVPKKILNNFQIK